MITSGAGAGLAGATGSVNCLDLVDFAGKRWICTATKPRVLLERYDGKVNDIRRYVVAFDTLTPNSGMSDGEKRSDRATEWCDFPNTLRFNSSANRQSP